MLLTEIDPHTDLYAMINHLSQVSQDAATMPWPVVRTWSTTCLDYVDDGQAAWGDSQLFMDERNRNAWSQNHSDATTPCPCPAYNNDACKAKAPHHEADMRMLHTCAICFYSGTISQRAESTSHNAKTCTRRKRYGHNDSWDQNGKPAAKKPYGQSNGQTKKDNTDTQKSKN